MAKEENNKPFFNFKEKLEHYTGVANGSISTKDSEKYSDKEQIAYARGQRDAMNAQNRRWRRKNSSKAEVKEYDLKKAKQQSNYWENKVKETNSENAIKKASWWSNRIKKLEDD